MPGRRTKARKESYYQKKFFFSIRERILLHLSEYGIYENEVEAPDALTQSGIAETARAGRSTVSKLLLEMEGRGLLYGRRAHVPSGMIRRTVYFLTPRGQMEAQKVRRKVGDTVVKVRGETGEAQRRGVLGIPREVPVHARLVDVVAHISRGTFDTGSFVALMEARRQKVAYLGSMPRLLHFFDRAEDLQALEEWLGTPSGQVLVLHGAPGVGKTTLAGKLVTDHQEETNVFWYRFPAWGTLRDVVHEIGEFLSRLARKDLLLYGETRPALDLAEVVLLLEKDLEGIDALMVFDGYDRAGGELEAFLSALKDVLPQRQGLKVLLISQTLPTFYTRKDVKVEGRVRELRLEGLDREGAATLLNLKNVQDRDADAIYRRTKGHPLFLELLQGPQVSDTGDVGAWLREEVYGRLLDVERRVLGLASVFRKPVHADALFLDDDVDFVVLTSLVDQALLRETTPKRYDLHELVRAFFYELLPPSPQKRYHRWAARFYTTRGAPADLVEAQYHHVRAGSPTQAAKSAIKHSREILAQGLAEEFSEVLEALRGESLNSEVTTELQLLSGKISELRGDWDDASAAYEEAAGDARERGFARLEAELRRLLGDLLLNRGEDAQAETELRRSLELGEKIKDLNGQAETHYSLGFLRNRNREFMEAYRHFRQGMRLVQRTGERAIAAKILYAFGVNYGQRGNYGKSVSYKARAMNILEEVRDLRGLAKVYTGLGASYQEWEDLEEAVSYYRKGIELARLIGDQRILAYGLHDLAGIRLAQERVDEAEVLVEEASAILTRLGERGRIGWSLLYEGNICLLKGQIEEAADTWKRGLAHLRASKDLRGVALYNLTLARLYTEQGDFVQAKNHLTSADGAARQASHVGALEQIREETRRVEGHA